jgi:hypothetical protein
VRAVSSSGGTLHPRAGNAVSETQLLMPLPKT